jgi:acyl carrier protein phosphodiesterase
VSKSISELDEASSLADNFYFPIVDVGTTVSQNYKVKLGTIKEYIKSKLEEDDNYITFKNINSITGDKILITSKDANGTAYIAESAITLTELNTYKNLDDTLNNVIKKISATEGEITKFNKSVTGLTSLYNDLNTTLSGCVTTSTLDEGALKDFYNNYATSNCVAQFRNGYLTTSNITIENLVSDDKNDYLTLSDNYKSMEEEYKELKTMFTEIKKTIDNIK